MKTTQTKQKQMNARTIPFWRSECAVNLQNKKTSVVIKEKE